MFSVHVLCGKKNMHQSILNKKRLTLPRGWGVISLIKSHGSWPYRYVPPKRVWFLGLFGVKTGIHSAIIVSGIIGYGFRENYGMNVFILSIPNE